MYLFVQRTSNLDLSTRYCNPSRQHSLTTDQTYNNRCVFLWGYMLLVHGTIDEVIILQEPHIRTKAVVLRKENGYPSVEMGPR